MCPSVKRYRLIPLTLLSGQTLRQVATYKIEAGLFLDAAADYAEMLDCLPAVRTPAEMAAAAVG